MPTSQELFESLHQDLAYRGLYGAQRKLEQYRAQVLAEYAHVVPALADPTAQPLVAAGFPAGEAPVLAQAGQAGLPADAPQPTVPIA